MLKCISLFLQISLYKFIIDLSFIQQTKSDLEVIDEEKSFYKATNKIQLDENNSYGYEFWFKFNLISQHTYQEVFEEEFLTNHYNSQEYSNSFLIFTEWDSHSNQNTVLYSLFQTQQGGCILQVVLYLQNSQYKLYQNDIGFQNLEGSWVYTHFGFQRSTNIFQWFFYSSEDRLIYGQAYQIDGILQDLTETTNIVGGSGKIKYLNQDLNLNLQKIRGRFTSVIFTKGILNKEKTSQYLASVQLHDICYEALFDIVQENYYLDGKNYLERVMFLRGKKFIIRGWNKLNNNKNQYLNAYLQMMRITTNKVYADNSNIGDKFFQLIYVLNSNLNKQSGIQVNVQRITSPFLSLYQGSFLDNFNYYDDDLMFKRLSNWIFFSFEQGGSQQQLFKIFFTYDSFSLSYNFQNLPFPDPIYQLADVPLYILIGGDKFQTQFYYEGFVQNLYIFTCLSEFELYQQYNPQQDYCHPICKTCNGPNEDNCLSCHDYQNRQYYIGKNRCPCNFGFSEQTFSYVCSDIFSLYKKELEVEKSSQDCQINIEINGLQICLSCPQINYRCYDCILNPNNWIYNPLCTKDIVYSSLSSSSMLINNRESKDYTFYTLDLEFGFQLCEGCEKLCAKDEEGCNQIKGRTHLNDNVFVKCKNEGFYFEDNSCQRCKLLCLNCVSLNHCQICLDGYYLKDGDCFKCQIECTKCVYSNSQKIICTACVENHGLIQGSCQRCGLHCISCEQSINNLNNNVFLRCLICQDNKKFMISYDQFNCIDNRINNCNYGFIYSSKDRSYNTLILDQDFITFDTAIYGCAQCEQYYEYDIQNSLCKYKYGENCQQFILDQGDEKCLVFTNYYIVFPNQPSLVFVNDLQCNTQIYQCFKCMHVYDNYYCLVCNSGYYVDLNGFCLKCPKSLNCKNCYIQSKKYKDNWKTNIKATFEYFYLTHYTDQSKYQELNSKPDDEYEILCYDCWVDYEFYNGLCIKACDCVSCVKIDNQNICEISPYFQDFTSLTINEGKIIDCSTYCLFCVPLLQEEIKNINPYFQSDQFSYYSNKCLIPNSKFNNLVYDPYLQQYKKCQTHSNCQIEISINYFLICQNEQTYQKEDSALLITIEELFSTIDGYRFKDFQNQAFYEYANAQIIENIIINIEVQGSKQCLLPQISLLDNQFLTNIFSIRNVKLYMYSQNSAEFVVNSLDIWNFQYIQLENIQFKPYYQSAFICQISSQIEQQIIFKNLNFTNQNQMNSFFINIIFIKNVELHNIRFNQIQTNSNLGLLQVTQAKSKKLYFKDLKLLNSILYKSAFINFNNVKLTEIIFEGLEIETEFQYSQLIQYSQSNQNDINMSQVSIQSRFIICQSWLHFKDQNMIELKHFIIQQSYIINSYLIFLRDNTQVSDIQVFQNYLYDQSIILYFLNGYSEESQSQLIISNMLFSENQCYNNYCLIYVVQNQEAPINQILLTKIYIYFNSRLSQQGVENIEEYETLIYLSLKTIIIDDLQVKGDFMSQLDKQIQINQIHINNFVSLHITSIKISNINQPSASYFYQLYQCSKLQQSSKTDKPILMIQTFQNLKLNFINIFNIVNFNAPIIKILSQNSYVKQLDEQILIQNINFTSNLLLTTQYFNSKSILEISSQQKQTIQIENFLSSYNILHEYIQDYSISSSNILLLDSPQSDITITNLYFISNTVINSSNTQLLIYCNYLKITNSTFIKHNQMDQSMIYVIFNIQFFNDKQVLYFEQLQNYFPIISQTGVGEFHFRNLIFQNIEINSTQGYKGGAFSLYPKNQGVIQISKSKFINIKSQFSLFDTKGGCFYILLPSFKIDIVFKKCTFSNVWTQNYGSIIFVESVIDHLINIKIVDVFIKNAFSLQGSVIYLKQNKVDLNSINQLVFQNVEILQEEENFVGYLAEYMTIQDDQLNQFVENRSLIYTTYSNVSLQNLTVLNIFQEMILECNQCEKILIKNLFVNKGNNSLGLFSIISDVNQISIYFSNIQFFNIYNEISLFTELNCNLKKDLLNLESGCYAQNQIEQVNLKNDIIFYYDNTYLQVLGKCNFNYIYKQIQNQQSLIQISIQSSSQQQIKFLNCLFDSIQISNAIIRLAIKTIPRNFIKFKQIQIQNNKCGQNGCIRLESNDNYATRFLQEQVAYEFETFNSQIKIDQLYCQNNNASNGVCLNIQNLSVDIIFSQFYNNTASEYGGSIYFNSNSQEQQLLFKFCQFYNNQALIAGAIYSNNIINNKWIKEYNYLNQNGCKSFGSTIVYPPMKLGVTFDNYNTIYYPITLHEGQNIKIDQIQFNKRSQQNYFNLPSGSVLNSYQTVTEDNLYINKNITFRLIGFDLNDEIMKNLENSSCVIYDRIVDLQKVDTLFQASELVQTSVNVKSIKFNNQSKDYNLDTIVLNTKAINNITYALQLIFFCPSIQTQKVNSEYPYNIISTHSQYYLEINIVTLDCQLGEISNQQTGACQQCDASQGFYSVLLNQTLCDVQDETTTAEVKPASLKLLSGYWRPQYDNRYITQCSNKVERCKGGWDVGYNSCEEGYFGALCEQCDIYNIRGDGRYSNTEQYQCGECSSDFQTALYAILLNLWNLFSIIFSVKSSQTSILNQVNKKNQIAVSTFLKIFINYFQLLFVVSTFQLPIPYQITMLIGFMGNPVRVISYSLDCALIDKIAIDIIYFRMIQQILYPFIYLFIMSTTYLVYTISQKNNINFSYLYIAISYLVLYYSPQILSSLINLMSYRVISNISWVQADVSFQYDTYKHFQWIYIFCIPLLIFLLISISSLFFLLFKKRNNLKKIRSIFYLGYLYLEYNTGSYFWEFVKLMLKILIAVVLTFLQERIFIKGCICFLILALYKSFISKYKPYKLRNINNIDQWASFVCLVSILFGMMLRVAYEIQLDFFPQVIYLFLAFANIAFTLYLLNLILQSYLRQYSEQLDEVKEFLKKTFPKLEKIKLCKKLLQNSTNGRNKAKQDLKRIASNVIQKSQQFNKSKLLMSKQQQVASLESRIQMQTVDDQMKTSLQLLQKFDLRRAFFQKQSFQNIQNEEKN